MTVPLCLRMLVLNLQGIQPSLSLVYLIKSLEDSAKSFVELDLNLHWNWKSSRDQSIPLSGGVKEKRQSSSQKGKNVP